MKPHRDCAQAIIGWCHPVTLQVSKERIEHEIGALASHNPRADFERGIHYAVSRLRAMAGGGENKASRAMLEAADLIERDARASHCEYQPAKDSK